MMLPTNFSVGSGPPGPVDVLLEASGPPPSFEPPVLALVVLELALALALVLVVVLALVPAPPAPPEPPAPAPLPSPPSEQPTSVAIPSATQAVLQSNREERFLFMSDFPFDMSVSC
ncbi:hypothetical protein [Sorangium cellulosum]|uniref:hypothetical protein n=1 Tax=Sorangium cellulosum TaxID=56 RepID=UPI001F463D5E|nr:hypothetical protein [Sorangium cellulosum]